MNAAAPGEALLEARGLTRMFAGLAAVQELSFGVAPGAIKAVIGPNGAGKTTLLNLLSGFIEPSAGEIRFGGARIDAIPAHARVGRGMARTFQNLQVFGRMTALENVMVGRHVRSRAGYFAGLLSTPASRRETEAARAAALAALARVGLERRAHTEATDLSIRPSATLAPLPHQGTSLTAAAHDAGFVDSAHLTHTFRDHFGLAPTDLLAATRFQPPD